MTGPRPKGRSAPNLSRNTSSTLRARHKQPRRTPSGGRYSGSLAPPSILRSLYRLGENRPGTTAGQRALRPSVSGVPIFDFPGDGPHEAIEISVERVVPVPRVEQRCPTELTVGPHHDARRAREVSCVPPVVAAVNGASPWRTWRLPRTASSLWLL